MANYHLPKLLNPLLNAIFNCPDVENSSLRQTYMKLKSLNNFIVIVPPTYVLLTGFDNEAKSTLEERCYNADFLLNHIIIPGNPNLEFRIQPDNQLFHTLTGRDIIIRQRNNCLFTADGFTSRRKYNIIKYDTLINFNDYFNQNDSDRGRKFDLIYIDQPLIDNKDTNLIRRNDLKCFDEARLKRLNRNTQNGTAKKSPFQKDKRTFENYLNTQPKLFQICNEVFTEFKQPVQRDLNTLIVDFTKVSDNIYAIMKENNDLKDIDHLKSLIREYCEEQVYDYVWQIIVTHFNSTSEQDTTFFHFLSLDQLDTEFYKQTFRMFRLSDIVQLEKNIEKATKVFTKLSISDTYSKKSKLLIETLQLLSKPIKRGGNIEVPIDADTLMSLFVLIINRLGSKNLKSHLFYLQHFCEQDNDIKFGLLGYALSTLEAVTVYIDSLNNNKAKLNLMLKKERDTQHFIELISLPTVLEKNTNVSNFSRHFKYRSDTGQSIISICLANFQNDIIIELLSNKELEQYFPLDDLLEDETIDGSTLLIQALKYSNSEIVSILVDILLENCSEYEIISYLRLKDSEGRNAAHFLNDQVDILERIGKYVDWDAKDCTNQTPLFTIFCRYDQTNYDLMVLKSLELSDYWYKTKKNKALDLADHVDYKGNTLLHVLKSNVTVLLKNAANIDVNKVNKKGLTPLMVFVKYNRLKNAKAILEDSRILFDKTKDNNGLDCFDYAHDEKMIELLGKYALENKTVFHHSYVHSLKFHQNTSHSLKISVKAPGTDGLYTYNTFSVNLKTIKSLFRVLLKIYPLTFLPLNDILLKLDNMASIFQQRNLKWIRLRDKETILSWLTRCLDTLVHMNILPISDIFNDNISLIEWIQEKKIELKEREKKNITLHKNNLLEPEQVNIIQNFLKFSLDELNGIVPKLAAMKKLVVFLKLKKIDIDDGKELLRNLSRDFQRKHISKVLMRYCEINITPFTRDSIDILLQNVEFIETCTLSLSHNILQVLNVKIPAWWKIYGELLELNRYDQQNILSSLIQSSPINTSAGNLFSNFIENKKLRNERQIHQHKIETERLLLRESNEINNIHEQLAEELSKFVRFKSEYFTFGLIKTWSMQNIKSLVQIVFTLEDKKLRK